MPWSTKKLWDLVEEIKLQRKQEYSEKKSDKKKVTIANRKWKTDKEGRQTLTSVEYLIQFGGGGEFES